MTVVRAPMIAVAGAASAADQTLEIARRVGRGLAAGGAVVLTGGRGGVMEAAARGAHEAGGRTIGILPGSDATASRPNPWIETPIFTGLGQARNQVLVLSADAVVAIGGSWGTLSEIALASKHGREVVLLRSWRLEAPTDLGAPAPTFTDDPDRAVELALRAADLRRRKDPG